MIWSFMNKNIFLAIRKKFAYDRHFVTAGFELINDL
jgi:hypothetical protein